MEKKIVYPGIFDRSKALFIDSIVFVVLIIIVTDIFEAFDISHKLLKMLAFLFVFVFYDPLCTHFFGCTLGHNLIGIKVKNYKNQEENISFIKAIFRFLVKIFLGWISLITISSDQEKRAIHDTISGSIVLYEKNKKQ